MEATQILDSPPQEFREWFPLKSYKIIDQIENGSKRSWSIMALIIC